MSARRRITSEPCIEGKGYYRRSFNPWMDLTEWIPNLLALTIPCLRIQSFLDHELVSMFPDLWQRLLVCPICFSMPNAYPDAKCRLHPTHFLIRTDTWTDTWTMLQKSNERLEQSFWQCLLCSTIFTSRPELSLANILHVFP